MRSLELAKFLEATFGNRTSTRHAAERSVKQFDHRTQHAFVVLDLAVCRRILLSKSFVAFNYFDQGIRRLEASGEPMGCINRFFDQGLLFREGPGHHAAKRRLLTLLDREAAELERMSPGIAAFMAKRRTAIQSPLDFATLFVRVCIGLVVARLTGISLPASMRIVRRRVNIFYFYFHAGRQRRANGVLAELHGKATDSGGAERYGDGHILAESLLTMGYDPLVGTLCAALAEGVTDDLDATVGRYCATSFVPRICVENTSIGGHRFESGNICFVSLVPAADEDGSVKTFPFGLGAHTCIGKRFSRTVLAIAEEIIRDSFPDGFARMPAVYADGAFLGFKQE